MPLTHAVHRVISVSLAGTATGNGASRLPRLSPDAAWILFESRATDLVTNLASPPYAYQIDARI